MTRRTITLTERRTRAVKLPRTEAHFLLAHARNLIDVVPAFERGVYRLTPRGYVGFIDGPAARYAIGPKIPWPNVEMLLGLKGARGTVIRIAPEGYYEVNLKFGNNTHRVLLPSQTTILINADPEIVTPGAIGEVER